MPPNITCDIWSICAFIAAFQTRVVVPVNGRPTE